MDLSLHKTKFPAEISEYFHSSWETRELWSIEAPRSTLPIGELEWHLDWPFFSSNPPLPLFDLKPRDVLDNPLGYTKHLECQVTRGGGGPSLNVLERVSSAC